MSARVRQRVAPRRALIAACILAILAATLLAGRFWWAHRGVPTLGGDFTLIAPDGRPWSLAEARGKAVLLEFGYTSCPDVCPTNLVQLAAVIEALGEAAGRVQAVFVSVDPRRDPPEQMGAYTAYFSPHILGLTGTQEQILEVSRRYGAFFAYQGDVEGGRYSVQHSSSLYLIDPDGELADVVPVRLLSVEKVAARVRAVLE